jgi:S1-C subfamily serine protease
VHSSEDVAAAIADNKPGQRIRVDFYRGSTRHSVTLTLGNRPNKAP